MSILDDVIGEYGFAVPKAAYDKLQEHIAARQPVGELHLPPDGFYKIVYDDAEVPDESFARSGALDAALRRFEQISNKWNAHLFVRFVNNTRDCTVPNAMPAQAVDLSMLIAKIDQACSYLSTALDDLDSSPDRRPSVMVDEAMGCLRQALTGVPNG